MIVEKPGKVSERITLLGRRESCVYLVDGKSEAAILGGGMAHIIPEVLEQIKQSGVDEQRIQRLIILHSHFDHCGMVPFFKTRWPHMTVAASQPAKELLAKPKVVAAIDSMNKASLDRFDRRKKARVLGFEDFPGIAVEEVLSDGDTLRCGDLSLEILAVPGHSPCSIAVYLPEQKAMFASDAGGIPFGDGIFTAANSDFDQYQRSLEKMAGYEVAIHLAEHYGARLGPDGESFLKRSAESAKTARQTMEDLLARTGDPKQSTEKFTDRIMAQAPPDFLPREIVALVVGQMFRFLDKQAPA